MPGMQDHERYRRILGIEAACFVDSAELKLEAGEIHVHRQHHDMMKWECSECGAAANCMTINRSGRGGTWTRAGIRRSCTPSRLVVNAVSTG
jgi:hypothetical protein